MKLPLLNKIYSVNIFIYSAIVKAIFTFLFYLPFWDSQFFYNYFDYLFWLSCILGIILFFSEIVVYITIFAMPIEFVLYKLKKKQTNSYYNLCKISDNNMAYRHTFIIVFLLV